MDVTQLINLVTDGLPPCDSSSGRARTFRAYRSAVNSFVATIGSDVPPDALLTPSSLLLYEKRLLAGGRRRNTVSFYMRMLRSLYNKAVSQGLLTSSPRLFSQVYTGIDNTVKRAVPAEVFHKLQALDLNGNTSLSFSRDLFLLSFSLQGISFIDLAYLRKSDYRDGIITYRRAKTGSPIMVAVTTLAEELIRKLTAQATGSPYLLPLIREPGGNIRLQYESALRTYNRRLKRLAQLAGIRENLTSYVARHSWATIARHQDVSMSIISQAMGHKSEEVTHIYLASFDHSVLRKANEIILAAACLNTAHLPKRKKEKWRNKNVRHLWSDGHSSTQM